ncbi:MAG: 2OG-Fe(II) oxygenase [Acidimicrobiaceae bacterium]|nr:2OG-Fe(II) oxygenase [Acidimicrobiaceae bacterium]HBU75872.1 2OG-Fe(II) oxygenase [Acidimicrobiaceae bacterium]|tara:strand:+ start:359 stop:1213 length:855 start_codon:yes stop_codon:yes gene_type:complete
MTPDVVDFAAPDAPERFTESLRTTGFAVVTNHPLPWELVQSLYAEWGEFFTSGAAEAYTVGPDSQEGYFPPKIAETAKGRTVRDLKEFFHVYPWSDKYPSEVSDNAMKYRDIATDVASTLLGWIDANIPMEVAEKLSRPVADMLTGNSRTLLRILRYPPLEGVAPEGAVRAAAHEDINLLTVLPASNETGLELLGADGEWYEVPCDPGSIAVNCGEMLDRATEGYLPATTHRVVNPVGEAATRARMSMPLFLAAADDVIITDGRTAEELLAERIAELRSQDSTD